MNAAVEKYASMVASRLVPEESSHLHRSCREVLAKLATSFALELAGALAQSAKRDDGGEEADEEEGGRVFTEADAHLAIISLSPHAHTSYFNTDVVDILDTEDLTLYTEDEPTKRTRDVRDLIVDSVIETLRSSRGQPCFGNPEHFDTFVAEPIEAQLLADETCTFGGLSEDARTVLQYLVELELTSLMTHAVNIMCSISQGFRRKVELHHVEIARATFPTTPCSGMVPALGQQNLCSNLFDAYLGLRANEMK